MSIVDDPKAELESFVEALIGERAESPRLLWHYTTAEGLLGILRTGTIWATGLDYLNDASEGVYISQLIKDRIKSTLPGPDGAALGIVLDMSPTGHHPLGVACFTEQGDLLSQWRAYNGGRGFAIGFDFAQLARFWVVESREGILASARYSPEAATQAAIRYADEMIEAWRTTFPGGIQRQTDTADGGQATEDDIERGARGIYEFAQKTGHLYMSGAFHKNSHFAEEREWRLVTSIDGRNTDKLNAVQTRVLAGGLALYRPVAFQSAPQQSPIRAIRIGPGLQHDAQSRALSATLNKLQYAGVETLSSSVPLRVV